ncbi:MAG: cyclic nucleotide-binding domain-containing protein [Dongiaceae bacterium]
MSDLQEIVVVALLGLAVTSSNMIGAGLGLYLRPSQKLLAGTLAFAAGALITALAIELGYLGALDLHRRGFGTGEAWLFIAGGFAVGAVFYYAAARLLDSEGAAIRLPSRFREYAKRRQRRDAAAVIRLLAQGDLMRHLPPERIDEILPLIGQRRLAPGEVLFEAGAEADGLYIVAAGEVEVLEEDEPSDLPLARLGPGQAFGEMALLTGTPRTATIRGLADTELLTITRDDFLRLMESDSQLAAAARRLSHDRAIHNLSAGGDHPEMWARVARHSLAPPSPQESDRLLAEAAQGAGLAIVFGNILDTIPGCLVIGAKFTSFSDLSLTLILGMFLGGVPEAAASGAMLRRAGFKPRTILLLWSAVLFAGVLAAVAGKAFIGNTDSLTAVFCQAIAGGAVLALIAHAMIPEAIEEAGSLIVLPTVAGFLAALYPALEESFH